MLCNSRGIIAVFAVIASLGNVVGAFAATAPLTPTATLTVPGGAGGFDWMEVDTSMHRLYAAHTGTKTLTVLDLATGTLLPSVTTGDIQGIAIDEKDGKVFVGAADDQKVVVLDRRTLRPLATIKLNGPVDAMTFDSKNGRVYADHDNGTEVWVIDAKTNTVIGSIRLSGTPEYVEYDPSTDRIYQNVSTKNRVAVIDPDTSRVIASWPTTPANDPHGLAVDSAARRLYTAGNGYVGVINLKNGKMIGKAQIAPGHVDQIVFDSKRHRLYCAVAGAISVLEPTVSGLKLLGSVLQPKGAHTIAVDPATGDVWICYADASASHLMKFEAS